MGATLYDSREAGIWGLGLNRVHAHVHIHVRIIYIA